jgi:hypothetical protein
MGYTKYIKTEDNQIIVFGVYYTHDRLKDLHPVSAGFISFGINNDGEIDCVCFGESISLGLKCDKIIDTELARKQILRTNYF